MRPKTKGCPRCDRKNQRLPGEPYCRDCRNEYQRPSAKKLRTTGEPKTPRKEKKIQFFLESETFFDFKKFCDEKEMTMSEIVRLKIKQVLKKGGAND